MPNRVLLYVMVPEVLEAQRKHRDTFSMKRLRDVAETYGEVVHAVACIDPRVHDDMRLYNSAIVARGYLPLAILPKRPRDEGMPQVQNPSSVHLLRDADTYAAQTVVIVAAHGMPSWIFPELRRLGKTVVLIATDTNGAIRSTHVDEWIPIQDVADRRPLPLKRQEEPETCIQRFLAEGEGARTHEMERLERHDPDAYAWLERILTVTPATQETVLKALKASAMRGTLPGVVIAALFLLAGLPQRTNADPCVRKNGYYRRLVHFGIDVDTAGRLALDLLAEEGTLLVERHRTDVDYLYARNAQDPVHRLGRAFCASLVRRRNRLAFMDASSTYADEVAQAFEIFSVAPTDLTSPAARDMCDFINLLLRHVNGAALEELMERGVPSEQAVRRLIQLVRTIISLPPALDEDGDAEDEVPSCERPHLAVVTPLDRRSA